MLKRQVITTPEGTKTLQITEWNECYHSHHGILQEALHVFIANGLNLINSTDISILEMGFGTGFNAFLSLVEACKTKKKITYYTLEKYPVTSQELQELEYWKILNPEEKEELKNLYFSLHNAKWGETTILNEYFTIIKFNTDFFNLENLAISGIHLVYYDAFGARVQPELWEETIFKQIYSTMAPKSLLTTYSSKGSARRAMIEAGFDVEKKSGPQGKREMVNAWKK